MGDPGEDGGHANVGAEREPEAYQSDLGTLGPAADHQGTARVSLLDKKRLLANKLISKRAHHALLVPETTTDVARGSHLDVHADMRVFVGLDVGENFPLLGANCFVKDGGSVLLEDGGHLLACLCTVATPSCDGSFHSFEVIV